MTSPARQAFEIYLRTGRRVEFEQKYNHNHDPRNGQFTFATGGAGSAAAFIRRGGGGTITLGGVADRVQRAQPRSVARTLTPIAYEIRPPQSRSAANDNWSSGANACYVAKKICVSNVREPRRVQKIVRCQTIAAQCEGYAKDPFGLTLAIFPDGTAATIIAGHSKILRRGTPF